LLGFSPALRRFTTALTTATIKKSGRDVRSAPAVATVTPGCRSSHHVPQQFYPCR
jgi:hypothetical protein